MIENREWLVTDRTGGFAMGTASGVRTRKYHGFYQRIASRGRWSGLADLDLALDGVGLWPHRYRGGANDVAPAKFLEGAAPEWSWAQPGGWLTFRVSPAPGEGIRLAWNWRSRRGASGGRHRLEIRPFFACRDLHGLGGAEWTLQGTGSRVHRVGPLRISESGVPAHWHRQPLWFEDFFYGEEERRGYPAVERLFSEGVWEVPLAPGQDSFELLVEFDRHRDAVEPLASIESRVADFMLIDPPGICAGFPWFGEWGRDSFIALPGIVSAHLLERPGDGSIWNWAEGLLEEWGRWIESDGMLPNVLGPSGEPQWESCDATLWWIHSLAALWSIALRDPKREEAFRVRFAGMLQAGIDSIERDRHRHLRLLENGLLEVSGGFTTWMDARIGDRPVTPRVGVLPEIQALWFQALVLAHLWKVRQIPREELARLAAAALSASHEHDRPNRVFLHSIPLAPSFVFGLEAELRRDWEVIAGDFLVPVGLRTLRRSSQGYCPSYFGDQETRDRAYHQGTVWPWLGGHAEMAHARLPGDRPGPACPGLSGEMDSLIPGHLPELADGDQPHRYRGAPAQAWSLACREEFRFRERFALDSGLRSVLSFSGL